MRTNVSYFRLRRELFDSLAVLMEEEAIVPCTIEDEDYMVLRQFLSSKNESITDDKRLSFDKSLSALRSAATRAINRHEARATTPAGSNAPS